MSSTEAVCIADEYPLCQISIPQYIAEKVWTDGKELASQDNNVYISPGCTDGSAWLVKSDNATHQRPYFVECKKSGQLCCEKSCIMFDSCGVCAHIVAVATRKKCLETFINWFSKRDSINVTKMAHSGLPKGAGKKTRSHRKFSTKSSTRKVKKILQDADSESYTPRPGITTKFLHNRSVQSPVASFSETAFHPYSHHHIMVYLNLQSMRKIKLYDPQQHGCSESHLSPAPWLPHSLFSSQPSEPPGACFKISLNLYCL